MRDIATDSLVIDTNVTSTSSSVSLAAGKQYRWNVAARNSAGCSNYTTPLYFQTPSTGSGSAPIATTASATNVTYNSATLNGTVNPNGLPTTVYFQYSATTTSWLATISADAGSGTTTSSWQATPSGLAANTTFYFRIVATNSAGTTYGATQTFTTSGSTQQTERLTNGGFTSDMSGWTRVGDFWYGTSLDYTGRYRTYPGYAAGGVDSTGAAKNNASGYMYQTVTIPSGATSATFSFWLNITSDETTTTTQYDKLFVEVFNSSGTLLTTLATYSNLDEGPTCGSTCIYNQKSFNLTSYKGQTIRIQFRATTDNSSYTVFRIDDVSLMSDGNY